VRRLKALNDKLKKHNQGHVRRIKALDDQLKKQNQAHVRKLKALNHKLRKIGMICEIMESLTF
jgi:uncharacterized membrane protein